MGVEENAEEAFRLYSEASDGKDLSALARVGWCLAYGAGVARNESKGVRYLRVAAEGGNWQALLFLAVLYRFGIGVEENKRKALVYYRCAADGGSWTAHLSMGEMYRLGEGAVVNIRKAIHHFEIYAKYEDDEAHCNLARIYYGEEGYLNENRGLYHLRIAADLGNAQTRYVVGHYFVSVSSPRKLSFTNDEVQVLVRKFRTQFARRKSNSWNYALLSPAADDEIGRTPTLDVLVAESSSVKRGAALSHRLRRCHNETPNAHSAYLVPRQVNDDYIGSAAVPRSDVDELKECKDLDLNRTSISKLTPTQLAPVLSAYLVSFDGEMVEEYCELKTCLLKYLKDNLISGAVLVKAEENAVRYRMNEMSEVICKKYAPPSLAKRDSLRSSFLRSWG